MTKTVEFLAQGQAHSRCSRKLLLLHLLSHSRHQPWIRLLAEVSSVQALQPQAWLPWLLSLQPLLLPLSPGPLQLTWTPVSFPSIDLQ